MRTIFVVQKLTGDDGWLYDYRNRFAFTDRATAERYGGPNWWDDQIDEVTVYEPGDELPASNKENSDD